MTLGSRAIVLGACASLSCAGQGKLEDLGPKEPPLAGRFTDTDDTNEEESVPREFPFDENPSRYVWQSRTRSPQVSRANAPNLLRVCGEADGAMESVAGAVARRVERALPDLDGPELVFALRTQGAPYVWPRAWAIDGNKLSEERVLERFRAWLDKDDAVGTRRCGIRRFGSTEGRQIVGAVVADVLADVEPIPTRARAGQWIPIRARLLLEATNAKVVVLGPRGVPVFVPTSLEGSNVKATFSADADGLWRVQLLATVSEGPRPVAEALVRVGTASPTSYDEEQAPGEEHSTNTTSPDQMARAMQRMLDTARREEGVSALVRDARLDEIARAHAAAMMKAGRVAHDVGHGDPKARVQRAGVEFIAAGENVAHARTLGRAHRVLWASPSHRSNSLHPRFDTIGIGVVRAGDGSFWVCEVFADL